MTSRRATWGRISLGLLALALLAPALPAWAVQGIGVSPTTQEVLVAAGQTHTGTFTVINDGSSDITYHLYATDYHVANESYQGEFTAVSTKSDLSPVSWIKLPTGTFTVKAHDQINVAYSVTPPRTASVGGHYAAVFIETVPPPNPGGTRIARIDRIGLLLYLAVDGDLIHRGAVLPLEAPWLQALPPLDAILRLRNDGNVHFEANGTVQLATLFGNAGRPVPFRGEVLPGTTRRIGVTLPTQSAIGIFKITATVHYLDRTETLSKWVLLLPRLTFLILSATLLLLITLTYIWWSRRRPRK